jgi:peptide/nickel transport system ATP-binding protein
MTEPLLDVRALSVSYRARRARRPGRLAVSGVSLDVRAGETVGLVGESGSGKSSIGRAVLGLLAPAAGSIRFDGADLAGTSSRDRLARSRQLQAIFQDPFSSLNPTRTIGSSLLEPLLLPGRRGSDRPDRRAAVARVRVALDRVGLPATAFDRYPAHFSGGQRQRIAIARALVGRPKLIICDEPVSALDLSVQAQVLNLLAETQQELAVAYLFISHDLAVVRYLAHRIVVLRHGQVVESGPADRVYRQPAHDYTRTLLAAAALPDPAAQYGRSLRMRAGGLQSATGGPERGGYR